MKYEFRSRIVETNDNYSREDKIEKACNEWAKEGFEVFSVICPQPSNYHRFRLTARRDIEAGSTPELEFK